MKAGSLRHFVSFESLVVDLDSDGVQTETWVDTFGLLIQAEINPLSGRELLASASTQSEVTGRIVVRYRPGILPSMRVVHRDVIYAIKAVIPDNDSGTGHITILTSSGLNEGQ